MNEIVDGHEQALWILAAGISLAILYIGFVRHWKDVRRLMEERRPKPVLRNFHDRDDPYQDDNNLGRN